MEPSTEIADDYGFYRLVMESLNKRRVPFLVGGAQMLERYTGIARDVKDVDLYLRRKDLPRALEALSLGGWRTQICYPHWLAKAYEDALFVDIIFGSGNGVCEINDAWFDHSLPGEIFGAPIRFCPPEEMIWSKAFVMERERYDGADIAHLLRSCGKQMNWERLLRQFEPYWRVLFVHLLLFGFIYPAERSVIPDWLMGELLGRVKAEMEPQPQQSSLCRGTLLSRLQYLKDVTDWGYADARLSPFGGMTPEEAAQWSAAAADPSSSAK